MSEMVLMIAVFAGSFAAAYVLILRVPPLLHTPLMSLTNAISGVTVVACVILLSERLSAWETVLGCLALAMGVFNLAGGFVVTDRLLRLFSRKATATGSERA